jgi:hypothetical protein
MKRIIIVIVSINLIMSCSTAQSNVDKAESAVVFAEQNKNEMSAEDWSNLEMKMAELENEIELNREKFTTQQLNEIGKLKGRYAALILKKELKNIQSSLKDLSNQMEGFIEGIKSDTLNK